MDLKNTNIISISLPQICCNVNRATSLLLTPYFLPSSSLSSHLLFVFLTVSSSRMSVKISLSILLQNFIFLDFAVSFGFNCSNIQHFGQFLNGEGSFFRENDNKFNIKVAIGHWILIKW